MRVLLIIVMLMAGSLSTSTALGRHRSTVRSSSYTRYLKFFKPYRRPVAVSNRATC